MRRDNAEEREEEEVNTPLMSISTAKLVKWSQEHLQKGETCQSCPIANLIPCAPWEAFHSGAARAVPSLTSRVPENALSTTGV